MLCNFHLTHCWLLCNALKLFGLCSQLVFNCRISSYEGRNHLLSPPLYTQLLAQDLIYNNLLKAWKSYWPPTCAGHWSYGLWHLICNLSVHPVHSPFKTYPDSSPFSPLPLQPPGARLLSSLTWIDQILSCLPPSTLTSSPFSLFSLFWIHQLEWYTSNVYVSAKMECTVPQSNTVIGVRRHDFYFSLFQSIFQLCYCGQVTKLLLTSISLSARSGVWTRCS